MALGKTKTSRLMASVAISGLAAPVLASSANVVDPTSGALTAYFAIALVAVAFSVEYGFEHSFGLWVLTSGLVLITAYMSGGVLSNLHALSLGTGVLIGYVLYLEPRIGIYGIILILLLVIIHHSVGLYPPIGRLSLLQSSVTALVGYAGAWTTERLSGNLIYPLRKTRTSTRQLLVTFGLGYVGTALYFGFIYRLLYVLQPSRYFNLTESVHDPGLLDFIYYSFSILVNGDYGVSHTGLAANHWLPKGISVIEMLSGVFWIVVYIGLVFTQTRR